MKRLTTIKESISVREDAALWFERFGRFCDEQTRSPSRGPANVLQRRMFEHYRRRRAAGQPCRMAVLKYRRAGSSTGSEALIYLHAHNYRARLGVIGTDYKASANMLEMLAFFGKHDDFPGWAGRPRAAEHKKIPWQEFAADAAEFAGWEDRIDKVIATKIAWSHGSSVELYTATNPESARSAGLNGFHATEVGRWPSGGQLDAGETLTSMRNTLPKAGFHLAIEESTANGAQGAFYDTCRKARWPEYADWPQMHRSCWPLADSEYGRELQFVFIFAAWFEDDRHFERDTAERVLASDPELSREQAGALAAQRNADRARRVEETLDAEPWYFGEKELIARYGQPGPMGVRLGGEVAATVWEQLAWRRGIIKNVCTRRGVDEFAQEYPSNPLEAFRASGAPVFDQEGIMALDAGLRVAMARPSPGQAASTSPDRLDGKWKMENGLIENGEGSRFAPRTRTSTRDEDDGPRFRATREAEAQVHRWEEPIPGCRYIVSVDPTKTAEIVKGTGERDRNSVLVLRDGFTDEQGRWRMVKLVARVRPPNQWEDAPLARLVAALAAYYGGAKIVVESNLGSGLITRLRDEHGCDLYAREHWSSVEQGHSKTYGWNTDVATRRRAVSTLQEFIRDQRVEILCPNVIAELKTFVFKSSGRAEAASGAHDDDVMALAIGLACLPHAAAHPAPPAPIRNTKPVDDHLWTDMDLADPIFNIR
jgi:hypothetical protein